MVVCAGENVKFQEEMKEIKLIKRIGNVPKHNQQRAGKEQHAAK